MSKKYNNIKKNVMALLMVLALILSGMFSRLLGNKLVEADTDNPCGIFPIPTRNLVYQNNYAQTGDDVRWVQMFLIVVMGYYDLSLDGSYGPNTRNAVKRFQNDTYSRFGLTADGKVGDYTRNAMLTMWKEYYYYNYTPVTQKRYNGHLYEVYDCNVKWADAAYLAESKGGHLITITSAAENQMIKDLIQNCASDFYWLGGTDYGTEGTFKWVNGESFSYTNFESGQPDNCIYGNYFAEDYLMIYKSTGTWNDYLDYKACAYIVEYDQVTANYSYDYNETLLGSATADNHWLELYECGVKWTEAKEFAQQKGGHLFTYTSNYSGVVALNNLLKNYGKSKKYWVGLTDRETEGVFMKVSGEQYRSGYMTWGEGEPNNTIHYDTCGTDEDYVAINSTTLEMNDINDEQAYGYIVEYDYMPVDSVSISSASIEMACGETCNLKVVISPENAANNEKTWWSSDNTIASVNKNGVVTAVGEGQTYIKVKVKTIRGYIQKSCPVKVTKTPSQMCEENGHIWDEGTVTHSETCTTDGTRKYVCTVCGEIKNETIKASGHKYQSRCEWHDDEGYATFYITCKNDPSHQGIVDTTNIVANVISETDTEKKIMYTATAGFEGWTFSNTKTVVISKVNPPVISIQPSNASMIWGGTAEFTVNATGDTLEYQWYESIDNGESWNVCNETGNTTNSIMITVGKSHDGRMYKCKISNEGGTVYSNPVKLTANSIISTQPKAVTVKEGDKATFSVACGSDSVKYQWQVSDNNGQSWDNSGATGNKTNAITFITKLKQNGYLYRCKVTNGNEVEYSKSVKLTVKSTVVITPPTITTAPSDASVVRGNTAKFTVSASGDNLKYQWYVSSDGGKTWSASGATGNKTKSITLNATKTLNGRYFKCEISNDGGKISTSPVKLTTLSVISTQPKAQTVTEGGKATFSIASRA
ncbi:Immunoglobulin domain-containing protein, partial [Eubacterium ruminantium]